MPSDTELQQLVIYVGTQAKIDEARQAGTIGPDDFAVVTDAPDFALQSTVQAIQVLIPSSASAQNQLADKNYVDNSTLPSSTKYGASLTLSINSTDYKVTATLKDQDGNTLGTSQVIDLPLESVVVGGSYDSTNKKIVLTLQNGNTIDIPVGDLVAGLQTEITAQNKLSSDLVDDTNHTNKFVTTQEKTTWNNKQNAINDLDTIRSGAALGATAVQPSALSGYVPTSRTVNGKALSTNISLTSDDIEYTTAGTTCTYVFDLFLTAMESLGDSIGGSFDEEGTFAKASYKTAYNVPLNNISDNQEVVLAIGWCDRSIGKLSDLTTTAKTDCVSAINELNSKAVGTFYWGE